MELDKLTVKNSQFSVKNFKRWEDSLGKAKGTDYVAREFKIKPAEYRGKRYDILLDSYDYIFGHDNFMPINQPYTLTDFRGIDKENGSRPKSSLPQTAFADDTF